MAKVQFPDPIKYLINGSNPALFGEISDEITMNYLVLYDSLVPAHGLIEPKELAGKIQRIYKSYKDGTVYIIAGDTGYVLNLDGKITPIFTLAISSGYIQIAENNNSQLGITTGSALYIYNYSTATPPVTRLTQVPVTPSGFTLNNPCTIVNIDTIFFVGDSVTSTVQWSNANNGLVWASASNIKFQSNADNIQSLAEIDRVLFIVGYYTVERWIVTGGNQLLTRDNYFLKKYGIYEINSFVSKQNMFIGIFSGVGGDVSVRMFEEGNFSELTSPGMIKAILNSGNVLNADLYEIDSILYYQVTCEKMSFIFNFLTKTWTHNTNLFEQVVFYNAMNYVGEGNYLYKIDPYNTQQQKYRKCPNAFIAPNFKRFTVDTIQIWYTNPGAYHGTIDITAQVNGSNNNTAVAQRPITGKTAWGVAQRNFNSDFFQFGLSFSTYANVYIRGLSADNEIPEGMG
jgi:hypothetical protein